MNVIQEIKDLKRRFNFLRRSYEEYQEPTNGVKKYRALLSQSSTDAPTVVILENTLGTLVWTYAAEGVYHATLTNAFTTNKTFCYLEPIAGIAAFNKGSNDTLILATYDETLTPTNALLPAVSLTIEVYP
jgi:hypothetical protein